MLDFKAVLKRLEDSVKFQTYLKKNPDAYLTNAIYLEEWQVNYFSPKTELITIFKVDKKITSKTVAEKRKFPKLNTNLKIDLKEALKILKKQISKFYSSETFTKTIIILQQSQEPEWNITQLSSSIKILNIKISAISGKITYESYDKLIDMK
ncbi:MAG: hypothetical protein CMH63_01985 [Nanoarchaeota archaeon]|jgi:hypothetical protein|nr:hypothetical protein [Nanoarchaeota archaeon]|tara:strand:- start:12732 stop:13187 length:456 start_codon:yes stop_codon:yes gene_type:complete